MTTQHTQLISQRLKSFLMSLNPYERPCFPSQLRQWVGNLREVLDELPEPRISSIEVLEGSHFLISSILAGSTFTPSTLTKCPKPEFKRNL